MRSDMRKLKISMKHVLVVSFCLVASITSTLSFADTAQMNATLSRISHVLSELNPLIQEAKKEQDPNSRVQFQFQVLQGDVGRMQAGIAEAINRVTIEPRVETPLSGDYLPISDSVLDINGANNANSQENQP